MFCTRLIKQFLVDHSIRYIIKKLTYFLAVKPSVANLDKNII